MVKCSSNEELEEEIICEESKFNVRNDAKKYKSQSVEILYK